MWHLERLLVILVLVSLVSAKRHRRDLNEYCIDLRRSMGVNQEVYTDAEVALREAQRHLLSVANIGADSRFKLLKAWKVVVHNELCNSRSAEYVSIIAECNPDPRGQMATLHAATQKYSKKCLTPDFWDGRLKKTLGSGDKTGLLKFMNQQFLDQYRKDNAREPEVHFLTVMGDNCCQADRSQGALLKALEPIVGDRSVVKQKMKDERENLENVMEKHLFEPCQSYVGALKRLMKQASDASDFSTGGKWGFIKSLSQGFKDALFRYKYCLNFHNLRTANAKLSQIRLDLYLVMTH